MRRWAKWIGLGLIVASLGGAAIVAISTAGTKLPGSEMTPAGYRQSTSVYVKMRDGVEIAVAILLPHDLRPRERVQF
jgi:predicted acyl esterase